MENKENQNNGVVSKFKGKSAFSKFLICFISAFVLLTIVAIICIVIDMSGSFSMNWYGYLIGSAIILCIIAGQYVIIKNGYYRDLLFDYAIFGLPGAILGARLYYVVFDMIGGGSWTFLKFWNFASYGGLAVYGGLIGTVVGIAVARLVYSFFADKPHVKFLSMTDIVFTFVPIGQAIGRWGCYFAGCCYGVEITDTAWQFFPFAYQPTGRTSWHLPTFFYESVFCTLLFVFLIISYAGKRKSFNGFNFSCYCIGYGICRCVLECFRADAETLYLIPNVLPVSIFVSISIFVFGVTWIAQHIIRAKMQGKKVMILVPKDKLSDEYLDYDATIYAHPHVTEEVASDDGSIEKE